MGRLCPPEYNCWVGVRHSLWFLQTGSSTILYIGDFYHRDISQSPVPQEHMESFLAEQV